MIGAVEHNRVCHNILYIVPTTGILYTVFALVGDWCYRAQSRYQLQLTVVVLHSRARFASSIAEVAAVAL